MEKLNNADKVDILARWLNNNENRRILTINWNDEIERNGCKFCASDGYKNLIIPKNYILIHKRIQQIFKDIYKNSKHIIIVYYNNDFYKITDLNLLSDDKILLDENDFNFTTWMKHVV